MVSKSKVESEVTTKGIWVLSPEEIAQIKNFKDFEGAIDRVASNTEMATDHTTESETPTFGVYLAVLPQDVDYLDGSSKLAWSRGAATLRICDVISPVRPLTVLVSISDDQIEEDQFDAHSHSLGWPSFIPFTEVITALEKHNSLAIRFEFVAPEPQTRRTVAEETALMYFDQLKHGDLAFRFATIDSEPRFIFALKSLLVASCSYFRTLFASGFAETTNSASITLDRLSAPAARNKSLTFDNAQLRPFYTATCQQPASSPAQSHGSDQPLKGQDIEQDSARPSKRKRSETADADSSSLSMPFIDITETDFTTYRAMLAYFHTSLVPFTSLPSDYLVARQAALVEHASEEGTEAFEFETPEYWFEVDFDNLAGQKVWHGIEPCSPHSMFRLADCYGIKELRELAKSRILRSLTIENVAYELFSPLSFDYEEIQEAVLKFFNKHWAEVKSTKGFETVLEKYGAGELPEALELVKKVWLAMEPVKKSRDPVIEKK